MEHSDAGDVHALRAEVARLRSLLGPGEMAFTELKLELWRVRDERIGMEAELGNARGRARDLMRQIDVHTRLERDPNEAEPRGTADGLTSALRKKASSLLERRP